MKDLILNLIKIYQKIFSPNHGIFCRVFYFYGCRFYPTCSQYAYQAIDKYGVRRGVFKTFLRILRCNPLNYGGLDPLK